MIDITRFLDEKLRVKSWPAKINFKKEILRYVSTKFEHDKFYTEKEVNEIINTWHTFGDYFLIRRGLVDYGFLTRTRDGARYWREKTLETQKSLNLQ